MLGRTHPRCSPNGGAASGVRRAAAPIVPVVDPRVYSNLRVWFDARLGVHRTGANLTQWDDLSANALNLTLVGGAMTSPQYVANVTGNGRPGFTFTGTQAIGTTASMSAQPATMFGVIRTGATNSGSLIDNYNGGGARWFLNTNGSSLNLSNGAGLSNTNLSVNTTFAFCCVANGASSSVLVNGTTGTGDTGAGALGSLVLGGIGNFGNATTATLQTFFFYNTLRTAPEIAAILAALKSDWGAA